MTWNQLLQNVFLKHLFQVFPIYILSRDICSGSAGCPAYSWLEFCCYKMPSWSCIIEYICSIYLKHLLKLFPIYILSSAALVIHDLNSADSSNSLLLPPMCPQYSERCKFLLIPTYVHTSYIIFSSLLLLLLLFLIVLLNPETQPVPNLAAVTDTYISSTSYILLSYSFS